MNPKKPARVRRMPPVVPTRSAGVAPTTGRPHGPRARPDPAPTQIEPGSPTSLGWRDQADLVNEWDRYFELFNLAPVSYALTNLRGTVREVNQAAAKLLGRQTSDLIGLPLTTFVAKPDRPAFLDHMRRVRLTEDVAEADLNLETPDGRTVPAHLSTRRSPRVDQPLCWTVIVDVTERQRLEEARRAADHDRDRAERDEVVARTRNEAKDRFIATLSHELRNPLAPALYAAAYLAGLTELPPSALRFVDMIRRNVEFEARLIDDLLDVTRLGQGKFTLTVAPVDAHGIVTECAAAARAQASAKGLELALDLCATNSMLRADQARVRQVIWNLLSNAIKFTPRGGHIWLSTRNSEHGAFRITVRDTGVGIDAKHLGTLFLPFEQAGRRDHGGLGLGLAISRGIVEAHHGRMWVSSRGPDAGATFEVEFDTIDDPQPGAAVNQPRERSTRPARRILVVEDHVDSAEMLRLALSMAGHEVLVAGSLAEARRHLNEPWDLIVSDLGLPDGSGLDLAREVRGAGRSTRLVALSGYGSVADRLASRSAGFDEHLSKPVLPSRLLELLP